MKNHYRRLMTAVNECSVKSLYQLKKKIGDIPLTDMVNKNSLADFGVGWVDESSEVFLK